MSESYNAISQLDKHKAWNEGYQQGKAEIIDALKNNCIEHIQNKRPLTLEEITNIILFEAEQLKK